MDYSQRLKWIENDLSQEPVAPDSPVQNRMLAGAEPEMTRVKLPLKHVSLFRPEHYEPGYAYPLIIWLHHDGESEQTLHDILPAISTRNYLGLSFRAPAINPQASKAGYYWPDSHLFIQQFTEQIQQTVRELSKVLNIHEQRIYLAGTGVGCSVATRLMLHSGDFYAGAALFRGEFRQSDFQHATCGNLKQKRILLDHSPVPQVDESLNASWFTRMLQSTGVEIQAMNLLKADSNSETKQLATLNRWIMEGISTARLV